MRGRVRATIRERGLLDRGDAVLVACSGGPDSTALVHVLHRLSDELGVSLVVASVDHGLRPESAEEVAHVGRFAASLGLAFEGVRVEVASSGSLQANARAARYDALHAIAAARGAQRIAVGHTRDDQAETVLDRMLRGAGVRGLAGIAPRREDGVVRPLIDVTRAEVEAYVARHRLDVLRDPSNEAPRFRRARIRGTVLPALLAESDGVVAHLAALADEARELVGALDARTPAHPPDAIPYAVLEGLDDAVVRATLRRWLASLTGEPPTRAHLEALARMVHAPGELWLPRGVCVRRGEHALEVDRSLQHRGRFARRRNETP